MSKNHKKVCRVLNDIDHLFIVISTITGCVSISAFAIGIASSEIGLKICAISTGIKKCQSNIKKKKKKPDKIVLLAKSKLNIIEVIIYKALVDLNISYDNFVLINNVLKEFYDIKEEIKNSNNK